MAFGSTVLGAYARIMLFLRVPIEVELLKSERFYVRREERVQLVRVIVSDVSGL